MKRKTKFIIAGVVLGVMLAGLVGGVALAQSNETSSGDSLLARVAVILGISQEKVEDAFAQAQKEIQAEKLDAYLQRLVEDEKLTQAQADEYKAWLESKPSDIPQLNGPGFFGRKGGPGFGGRCFMIPPDGAIEKTAIQ
jgi:hypothetical protein